MVQVNGGAGSGKNFTAGVNSDGQMLVNSESQPHDRALADQGLAWSLDIDVTPTADGDYFFYLKNTGTTELHLTDVRLSSISAAERYQVVKVTGTPSGGSAITPVNRNVGSSKVPTATIESGVDITGLTSSGTIFRMTSNIAARQEHLRTSSNIHIPQGSAIALIATTGGIALEGTVSITADPSSAETGA
ncbi:MAG: hypothetical protein V3V85_04170 [Candidatus Thorarchaeota archaeon]